VEFQNVFVKRDPCLVEMFVASKELAIFLCQWKRLSDFLVSVQKEVKGFREVAGRLSCDQPATDATHKGN
jgi:hypothetical protein